MSDTKTTVGLAIDVNHVSWAVTGEAVQIRKQLPGFVMEQDPYQAKRRHPFTAVL